MGVSYVHFEPVRVCALTFNAHLGCDMSVLSLSMGSQSGYCTQWTLDTACPNAPIIQQVEPWVHTKRTGKSILPFWVLLYGH